MGLACPQTEPLHEDHHRRESHPETDQGDVHGKGQGLHLAGLKQIILINRGEGFSGRKNGSSRSQKIDQVQPIETMRSIGRRALSARSSSTLTSNLRSRSESRSFGRVIIFMYLQKAILFASIRLASGAAL